MTIPFVLWYVNSTLPPCSHSNSITWLQMKKSPATATGTDPARLLTLWRVFPGMEIRAVITWLKGMIKIHPLISPVCQRGRTWIFLAMGVSGSEVSRTSCAWLSVNGVFLTSSWSFQSCQIAAFLLLRNNRIWSENYKIIPLHPTVFTLPPNSSVF